jgi:mRNA interferase RelE/StbE
VAGFDVRIKPSALKELETIDSKRDRQRLVARIQALGDDPRPPGCKRLVGSERYRIRSGSFRVLYTIEDDVLVVEVIRVAHRRVAYR